MRVFHRGVVLSQQYTEASKDFKEIMPVSVCNGDATCSHGDCGKDGDEDSEYQLEESDPSGRYIRYKEILGRGAFKTVYRGFDKLHGIEVAWNQVRLQDILGSPQDLERLYSEVHLLKTLKHRNIIKFHHSWVDSKMNRINFITELFTSGTLRQYRKRHKHVDLEAVKHWCRQILRGLLYLHSHDPPIIHRDLKCDNVFINGNHGEVKIGDLGLAAILCQTHAAHSIIGTPEFMAPELYEEEYNELVDIYSFGMCLLEMVTSEYPYSECDSAAQIYKKVSSGIKPAALEKLKDAELRQFVEKCIDAACRRLPARELLMDPFLQYDKDHNPADCQPVLSRNTSQSQDMEEFGALLQKASLKSLHVDTKPNLLSCSSATSKTPAASESICGEHVLPKNPIRRLASLDLRQGKTSRNMDFKVKGKKRENEIVYLRLRMSAEGNVRDIHFHFDVEADSAMCVASEMVQELDLADQDVIKIAEMIDAAVLAMVPEWKPGVAIDERCDGEEMTSKDLAQDHLSLVWGSDTSTLSSDSCLTEPLAQVPHSWVDSVGGNAKCLAGTIQSGGNVHGRFEEVLYHRRLEHGHHEEPCNVTTQSSEDAGDDWEQSSSSDGSPVCPGESYALDDIQLRDGAYTSDGLWQSTDEQLDYLTSSGNLYNRVMDAWGLLQNGFYGDSCGQDSEILMQEVRNLTLKFQRDLKELQDKHRKALLELRKQWQSKRTGSCGRGGLKYGSFMSTDGTDDGFKEQVMDAQKHGRYSERDCRTKRQSSMTAKETSGRLSFDELASLFATVEPPGDLKCPNVSS